MQERDDVHGLCGGKTGVLALEQARMEELHIRGARRGWGYNVVDISKHIVKLLGQGLGHVFKPGITHGLTATSLFLGVTHLNTKVL